MRCLVAVVAVLLPIVTQAQDETTEERAQVVVRTEPRSTEAARNKGVEGTVNMLVELNT
jgi:hypothetical protein